MSSVLSNLPSELPSKALYILFPHWLCFEQRRKRVILQKIARSIQPAVSMTRAMSLALFLIIRSKHMSSNYYLIEKLVEAHRQELLREAEQSRLLKEAPRSRFQIIRRDATSLGSFFGAVGARLKRGTPSRGSMAREGSGR